MKKVRIIIPAAEKEIDIECNEQAFVRDIMQDIRNLLKKKGETITGEEEQYVLCKVKDGCILEQNKPLGFYQIVDGESFFYL